MLSKCNLRATCRVAAALLIALLTVGLSSAPASANPDDLVNTDVSFPSGTSTLHGTVVAPAVGTHLPAVVMVAGAGARNRDAYRPEAEAFARTGIVVLIYDKRSDYTRATSSFATLADDANAGIRLLRTRTDVDPARVGLWGHSEGGWVAPLAAATSTDVAFLITVGASAWHTDRTQLWSDRTYLAHAGVADSLIGPIGLNLSRMLVSAGLFGDVHYDPVATLARVHQPVLAVFAAKDRSTVPGESAQIFQQALQRGGNQHYTIRTLPNANHNMRQSTSGFDNAHGSQFAPGYIDLMTSWIADLASGPPPASADTPPAQDFRSTPVRPLAWYESVSMQLALLLAVTFGFLAYLVGGVIRRLRRRSAATHGRWPALTVAVGGLATVLATMAYLFSVVTAGATNLSATVAGRPPQWLALQLCAVGVVVAAVLAALRWRQNHGPRQGILLTAAILFVPWATYWGLFTP